MNQPYETVIIIESPVTDRYVRPGNEGQIDHKNKQIRVSGVWFNYDTTRWKVKTKQ